MFSWIWTHFLDGRRIKIFLCAFSAFGNNPKKAYIYLIKNCYKTYNLLPELTVSIPYGKFL